MNAPFRYYPVTPVQKKWGLYVTCVGHNTTQPGSIFPSPEHPDEYYFTWKVGRILHEWQIILIEKGRGADDSSMSAILMAQMHIMEHLSETIDFEALAQKVGLTYRSFRYLFTKESGLSPLQYQLERRLARAKNLLASSDMPVKDIAETLGFNSSWYFAHFFRKHMNCSPATYRNRTHSVQ